MTNHILSLVNIPSLDHTFIDSLQRHSLVKGISVAPSHFGTLNPNGAIEISDASALSRNSLPGLSLHSLQGLLYNPNGISVTFDFWLNNRLQSISDICYQHRISRLVLGAPHLRRDLGRWREVLTQFQESFSSDEIEVSVENLCSTTDSAACSPFGPVPLDDTHFKRTLDISNALKCATHSVPQWITSFDFAMVHTSGPDHSAITTAAAAQSVLSFLRNLRKTSDLVWEFQVVTPEASLVALDESLRTLRSLEAS